MLQQQSAPPTAEPDSFMGPWVQSVSSMGVVAVVPPTEDIYVGDLFLYQENPDRGGTPRDAMPLGNITRWNSVPALAKLEAEYQHRISWPPTPSSYQDLPSEEGQDWEAMAEPGGTSLFSPQTSVRRLRSVNIGPLSATVFVDGNLSRLVPLEATNLVRGAAWADDKVVSVRLGDAETYSLSLHDLFNLVIERQPDGTQLLQQSYRESLDMMHANGTVWMRVVGDVIYVRSVDITVQARSGYKKDDSIASNSLSGEPVAEGEEIVELDPQFAAFARAKEINEALAASNVDDSPSAFIRFISVTEDSMTMRRTFRYPFAIGVRGLTLEINAATGEIIDVWPMGWSPPAPPTAATPVPE